jgi:hypothetical protein
MEKSRPAVVTLIAILQFIPVFLLPLAMLSSVNPVLFVVPLAFFVFLAWAMLTLKPWAMTLCIFVQGLNVIARFLILFPNIVGEMGANWAFLIAMVVGIGLSTAILYVIDQPKVQVAFTA